MTPSVREKALEAFFEVFAPLPGYRIKKRMPSWILGPDYEVPALIQVDGGDEPEPEQLQGQLLLSVDVSVAAILRSRDPDDLAADISHARAQVRLAVGVAMTTDPTLGGRIRYAEYAGTQMMLELERGAPPSAVVAVNYVLRMEEHEFDPYRTV